MIWKLAVPIFLVLIILGGFLVYKHNPNTSFNPVQPVNAPKQTSSTYQIPQTVTAQNADSTLNSTDAAINQSVDQMDSDLKDLDSVNKEEDPSSL